MERQLLQYIADHAAKSEFGTVNPEVACNALGADPTVMMHTLQELKKLGFIEIDEATGKVQLTVAGKEHLETPIAV